MEQKPENTVLTDTKSFPSDKRIIARYDRSFAAKLSVCSDETKGYYASLVNRFLAYKKVKTRRGWAATAISAGRIRLAVLTVRGKTLRLYVAADPSDFGGKYSPADVSSSKKYARTPALFKIRSDGAAKNALAVIDKVADNYGLTLLDDPAETVLATDFPKYGDDELLARGLIRPAKRFGEEGNAAVLSSSAPEWTRNITYSRSFSAKLSAADDKVKEYYAAIVNAFSAYKKVKARVSWPSANFTAGREKLAAAAIRGKTLCVYLAVDPASSDGKYKPKDVSSSKKFARTPAMFRIKSDGALRKVLSLIDEISARCGLTRLDPPPPGVKAADFPFYTDAQLLDRGLIRPIKRGEDEQPDVEKTDDRTDEFATKEEADDAFSRSKTPQKAYDDAVKTLEELFGRHDVFGEIKSALSDGIATVESSEKTAFRGIDEKWIKAIEDCLPAIDSLVRNPSHHIRETEEVLPIELTKKITGRSVQHLGRHADYITVTEDGEITPTKILNVFRDDSIETYENKFLNTLLARLDSFVGTRYEAGRKYGADEKSRTVALTDVFNLGELRGRIKISLELSEPYEGKDVGKAVRGTELWRRLCAVRDVIATYRNSAFAREMGNAFVYPPVARTNAIMKNKYFRQCLELWELINSYEDEGEGFTISEKFFEPEETAVRDAHAHATLGTLLLKTALTGVEKTQSEPVAQRSDDVGFSPRVATENIDIQPAKVIDPKQIREETVKNTDEKKDVTSDYEPPLDLGLDPEAEAAATIEEKGGIYDDFAENRPQDEKPSALAEEVRYRKTFLAKIILAPDAVKARFADLANALLGYDGVKMRFSRSACTFKANKKVMAKLSVRGNTICAFFAVDPSVVPERFKAESVTPVGRFDDVPTMIRVKSDRTLLYAKSVAEFYARTEGLGKTEKPSAVVSPADYPASPVEELIARGLIIADGTKKYIVSLEAGKEATGNENDDTYAQNREAAAEVTDFADHEKAEPTETEKAAARAELLAEKARRHEREYSRPTEYGLDKADSFFDDEKEVSEPKEKADRKGVVSWLIEKLRGRKK